MAAKSNRATGLKILIAEDNFMVAMDIKQGIEKLGHDAIGPFSSVVESLAAIKKDAPDFAFLDVELLDERSFMIAQRLDQISVPYAFVTARTDLVVEAGYKLSSVVVKPFRHQDLEDAIDRICAVNEDVFK